MIVLGIDPALRNIGYAVLEKNGSQINYIHGGTLINKHQDLSLGLHYIYSSFEDIILKYKPNTIALEKIFININPISSITLSYARGVIISVIGKYGIALVEFAPNYIKKAIAGNGKATKEQMMKMVNYLLPKHNITDYDESDAIACAYTACIVPKASYNESE
jgi:crossover junction endodeoxyribonuclease RuvC